MVVFIAALFSPNTIGFHPTSSVSSLRTSTTPSNKDQCDPEDVHSSPRTSTFEPQHGRSQSLIAVPTFSELPPLAAQLPGTIGRTPGATNNIEDVFRPYTGASALQLTLPDPAVLSRNKSATSLTSLGALDPQVTHWGKPDMKSINQPESLAISPPSQSIFKDAAKVIDDEEESEFVFPTPQSKPVRMAAARPRKKNVEYTTENYSIQASTLGNAGLFSAVSAVADQDDLAEILWIGTLGMPTDALSVELKAHIAEKLENEHGTLVVYVEDTDMHAHYENYCKTILWPHFHSQVPDVPTSKAYQDNSWSHYVKANEAFAECIVKNYKKDDIVWVNDYHLMLVPGLVRKHHPDAQIGLYMHSAFPPSEIFRNLPSRCELLLGMLGSNMIAFQTDEFRYQFLQTCSRLLNIEATDHGLVLENGRFIDAFTIPVGIDINSMKLRLELPEVDDCMKELKERFAGKRIIVSRDKLDGVHGIKHKLRGFRELLERYPDWEDQVVLVQIVTSVATDRELKEAINDQIMSINGEWGSIQHQPVVFLNKDIDYAQYLALLAIADCMLVTSLSEGMNLTCHEFVVSQDKNSRSKGHAPLVISESIGAAKVYGDAALLINPWHPKGIAETIHKALNMTDEERAERWGKMYALTEEHSARKWFKTYLSVLGHAWKEHTTRDPKSVPRLQLKDLRKKWDSSEKRLLFLDFEGTLTPWDSPKENVLTVPLRIIELLTNLSEDEKNIVYVASQYPMESLEHMFRMVPKIGLIAENGAFLRKPEREAWTQVTNIDIRDWRDGVMNILEATTVAIPGSMIRELKSGMMFSYFDAEDQKDAFGKAGEMANQINEMCENLHVSAVPFEKGIYIHPSKVNKAMAMKVVENDTFCRPAVKKPDFVFVIGDSNDDECVFKWAQELEGRVSEDRIFTCAVGNRNTAAKCVLTQGTGAVVLMFEKLVMNHHAVKTA